jgi:alkylhydroperoxidase family enzyme
MGRLPLVDPEGTSGDLRATFDRMPVKLNLFRTLAHAESCAVPVLRLGDAILHRQTLGDRCRELLILQVAGMQGGAYEWRQHVPIAEGVGVSRSQIEAIEARNFDPEIFSAEELALLAFGENVIEDVRVDAEIFRGVEQHFSSREIVEAILTIGFYMMMARLTEATETDLDPPAGMAAYESGARSNPTGEIR